MIKAKKKKSVSRAPTLPKEYYENYRRKFTGEKTSFNEKVAQRIKKNGKLTEIDKEYFKNYWRKFPSIGDSRGRPSNVARNRALRAEYLKRRNKGERREDIINAICKRQTFEIYGPNKRHVPCSVVVWKGSLINDGTLSEERIRKICNSKMK